MSAPENAWSRANRFQFFNAATSADIASNWVERTFYIYNSIAIVNAGGATVQIMVSMDQVNWIQYGANITTTAFIVMAPGVYPYIQILRDNSTSGSVTADIYSMTSDGR